MIKRLFEIARSNIGQYLNKKSSRFEESHFFNSNLNWEQSNSKKNYKVQDDPFAKYFANLELPINANRDSVKASWKRLMKKYHPDLHSANPEKRKIATEK